MRFRKPAPPSDQDAMLAVRTLIEWMGDDPLRPGLRDTPERVIKAWKEDWGRGYREAADGLVRMFPEEGLGNESLICMNDIAVQSVCEHHMAPFTGTASIGYISDPARGIVGLSKLARIVEHFSRRLQVQERLTNQIANFVEKEISGIGVGVVLRCTHSCMSSRGARQPNAITITSALRGAFYDDGNTRAEFLRLAKA